MPRLDATGFKVSNELAARLDAINKAADFGYSRNQLAEKLLDECCKAIESEQMPPLPRTIVDARSRLGKSQAISEEEFATALEKKILERREKEHQEKISKIEDQIAQIQAQLKGGKAAKK